MEMNIERVREICADMRQTEAAWKRFLDLTEQKIALSVTGERSADAEDDLRTYKRLLSELKANGKSFSALRLALEKCAEEYRFADERVCLSLQQRTAVGSKQGAVRMNDLREINRKMQAFQIRSTEA